MSKRDEQNKESRRQRKERERLEKKQQRRERYAENKEMYRSGYILVGLLACMLAYFIWFEAVGRQDVINNPLNNRFDSQTSKIIRGNIETFDGLILAQTVIDEEGTSSRIYPYSDIFAQITGYTAMGRTCLEESQNRFLMTASLSMLELFKNEITETKSQGDKVVTTIDGDLQQFCYNLLGDYRGSITILEPSTGKVLAMVSKPSYDPNTVKENWDWLVSDENTTGNLMNRSSQGLYAPGSTFKIVTALEYMIEHPEDYQDFTYVCTGSYDYEGNVFQCSDGAVHGEQHIEQAMANSCNCFFAEMGRQLDPEKWQDLCVDLGFNQIMSFTLPSSISSFAIDASSSTWDLLQTGFGQGQTVETPLLNAMITAMVANDGTMMQPYIVDHIENADGEVVESYAPVSLGKYMTDQMAEDMNTYLLAVVNAGTATATVHSDIVSIAGKSGSAQYSQSLENLHAWFTAYAPAEDPELAVTVMLEQAGGASATAGPMIKQIMEYYYTRNTAQ